MKSQGFADSPEKEQIFPKRVRVFDSTWKVASDAEILRLGRLACSAYEAGQGESAAVAAVKESSVSLPLRSRLSPIAEESLTLRARETLCAPKITASEKAFIDAYRAAHGRSAGSDDQTVLSAGRGTCELLAVRSVEESITALEQAGYTEADARAEIEPAARYLCDNGS